MSHRAFQIAFQLRVLSSLLRISIDVILLKKNKKLSSEVFPPFFAKKARGSLYMDFC